MFCIFVWLLLHFISKTGLALMPASVMLVITAQSLIKLWNTPSMLFQLVVFLFSSFRGIVVVKNTDGVRFFQRVNKVLVVLVTSEIVSLRVSMRRAFFYSQRRICVIVTLFSLSLMHSIWSIIDLLFGIWFALLGLVFKLWEICTLYYGAVDYFHVDLDWCWMLNYSSFLEVWHGILKWLWIFDIFWGENSNQTLTARWLHASVKTVLR